MQIKQATLRDLPRILAFVGERELKRKEWHIPAKRFISSYITNKHNFFFICMDNNRVVGSLAGEDWADKGFAYLGDISVASKNKQEIVDRLFAHFKAFCTKKRITLINTFVKKSSAKNIRQFKYVGMKKKGDYIYLEQKI